MYRAQIQLLKLLQQLPVQLVVFHYGELLPLGDELFPKLLFGHGIHIYPPRHCDPLVSGVAIPGMKSGFATRGLPRRSAPRNDVLVV